VQLPRAHLLFENGMVLDPKLLRVQNLRRVLYTAAEQHEIVQPGFRKDHCKMVTLTYENADDWSPKHISATLSAYKKWAMRRNIPLKYTWVMELQKRGAPHYHILFWLPPGTFLPLFDKRGWWKHGSTNLTPAKTRGGYLLKYVSKCVHTHESGTPFPKSARIYGVGGLTSEGKRVVRWYRAPRWVRDQACASSSDLRKLSGGWTDRSTGLFFESPWVFLGFFMRRPLIYRRDAEPPPFHLLVGIILASLEKLQPGPTLDFSPTH